MFAVPHPKKDLEDAVRVPVRTGSGLPLTRRARQQRRERRNAIIGFVVLMGISLVLFIISVFNSSGPPPPAPLYEVPSKEPQIGASLTTASNAGETPTLPREESTAAPTSGDPSPTQTQQQQESLSTTIPSTVQTSATPTTTSATPTTITTSAQSNGALLPDDVGLLPNTEPPYKNPFDPDDRRTARPEPQFSDIFRQHESGEVEPEEPQVVPGLTVHRRTFTPEELLERFGDSAIVYSFVNGTELNHYYRKLFALACTREIIQTERSFYEAVMKLPDSAPVNTDDADAGGGGDDATKKREIRAMYTATPIACRPVFYKRVVGNTTAALLETMRALAKPDGRDRETDELKHSLRSVEQHIRWHRGKVTMVSPGHHPLWMDGAKGFLAGSCGGDVVRAQRSRGVHLRMTTVHQDAIMPYGMRLTVDTNSIEPHLWRVKNITPVHLYYNDDYFVNRDVSITDIFNEYGGTIVRTEKGILRRGIRAKTPSGTWGTGVRHTHLFNIIELDARHEDYLPEGLIKLWQTMGRYETVSPQEQAAGIGAVVDRDLGAERRVTPRIPPLETFVDISIAHQPEQMVDVLQPRRWRRYATHAPFTYCTNMWRYFEKRYEREFAYNAFHHRTRHPQGIYTPFVYNAFIMARPWAGSPKYLPYLIQLGASRIPSSSVPAPHVNITLDNFDGCGPATLRGGYLASECVFAKFLDNMTLNYALIDRLDRETPLYFNINAGFSSNEASDLLRQFLGRRFRVPIYLERGVPPVSDEDRALPGVYAALMRLPVIAVSSFAEGLCPMVRSLQLALRDHTGAVVSAVARHGAGADVDPTLLDLRVAHRHRVRNAMPVVDCTYSHRVHPLVTASPSPANRADALGAAVLARIVDSALSELRANGTVVDAAVVPSVCGVGVGGGGDVRVRAIVLDGRAAVTDALSLRRAVTMPGQTLALEDFDVVPLEDGSGDAVLVLSRQRSDAKAVHWVDGASTSDLLLTYPIPYAPYEDLRATIRLL